jgi:two-component system sensor histidine kinase YesM
MELILLLLGLWSILSGAAWVKWRKKYDKLTRAQQSGNEEMQREYAAQALTRQMQYAALQGQINPHFLYNTLDSIRSEALLSGHESIANMTERLSRFFRYCISHKGDLVTIRDEINNILDYFYIQEYRFGDKFKLDCQIEESCYAYQIPKMSLQPLVENSIQHGLESKKHGGRVVVEIFETRKQVKIQVSDDGIGIEEERLAALNDLLQKNKILDSKAKEGNLGIALKNVSDRIKLQYGSEYGMHLRSALGKGTDVEMVLPKVSGHEEKGNAALQPFGTGGREPAGF